MGSEANEFSYSLTHKALKMKEGLLSLSHNHHHFSWYFWLSESMKYKCLIMKYHSKDTQERYGWQAEWWRLILHPQVHQLSDMNQCFKNSRKNSVERSEDLLFGSFAHIVSILGMQQDAQQLEVMSVMGLSSWCTLLHSLLPFMAPASLHPPLVFPAVTGLQSPSGTSALLAHWHLMSLD